MGSGGRTYDRIGRGKVMESSKGGAQGGIIRREGCLNPPTAYCWIGPVGGVCSV